MERKGIPRVLALNYDFEVQKSFYLINYNSFCF